MKAYVDKDACIGCNLCEELCPKVFKMTDDGYAVAADDDLDDSVIECANESKDQCPVEAITIE